MSLLRQVDPARCGSRVDETLNGFVTSNATNLVEVGQASRGGAWDQFVPALACDAERVSPTFQQS